MKTEKLDFSSLVALASEASFMCSEERRARKELYEVPGGNLYTVPQCRFCLSASGSFVFAHRAD
eukprot:8334125-Pyramimonas_sp.AAC.1